MGKLEEARRNLAQSTVASRMLLQLFGEGTTRSSVLVKKITDELKCSTSLVYEALSDLVKSGLVYSPEARKRLKFYSLTREGTSLVNEEVLRKETEIRGFKKQIPEPTKDVALELLTEEIFQELPSEYKTAATRMLVRQNLDQNVTDTRERVLKRLQKRT